MAKRRLVVVGIGGCAIVAVAACVADETSSQDVDGGADANLDGTTTDAAVKDAQPTDSSTNDAAEAAAPACNPTAAFGAPVPLTALNNGYNTIGGFISEATHEFYFARWAQSTVNDYHPKTPSRLFRASVLDAGVFSAPSLVTGASQSDLDAGYYDYFPTVTPDGLNLYFDSYTPAFPSSVVFFSVRNTVADNWGPPDASVFSNTTQSEYPIPGAVYATFNGPLYRYVLGASDTIGSSVNVDPDAGTINAGSVYTPAVTPDELNLYFTSTRSGAFRIWLSTRAAKTDPWGAPALVPLGVSGGLEMVGYITPDNCTLYFSSSRTGPMQMYYATRGQ